MRRGRGRGGSELLSLDCVQDPGLKGSQSRLQVSHQLVVPIGCSYPEHLIILHFWTAVEGSRGDVKRLSIIHGWSRYSSSQGTAPEKGRSDGCGHTAEQWLLDQSPNSEKVRQIANQHFPHQCNLGKIIIKLTLW